MDEIMTDRQVNQSHFSSTTEQKLPAAGLNLRAHRPPVDLLPEYT